MKGGVRMKPIGTLVIVVLVTLAGAGLVTGQAAGQMPGMARGSNLTPPVPGFYRGERILFIHTEASDPKVAAMLTRMMGPKVLVVPSLGKIPRNLLATVYAFQSGVRGEGPFGYQPDVFDSAPGDATYTPLRHVNLVNWQPQVKAKLLGSAEDVKAAAARGEVTVRPSGIVVNMPMLTWPGGSR